MDDWDGYEPADITTADIANSDITPAEITPADIMTVRRLLRVTADEAGGWSAPPSAMAMVVRRRGRHRAVLGAAVAVVAIIGVAVPVALTPSHRRSSASALVGPSVTASISTVLPGGTWSSLPKAPIVARSPAAAAWTGTQMLVWGGANGNTEYADGAAYNPATRVWGKLPPSPLAARSDATSVWTGKYLFIWGGGGPSIDQQPDGALYDPAVRRWTKLPKAPVTEFSTVQAYWTGRQVLLLSEPGPNANHLVLQAFDPSTRRWMRLPDLTLRANHDGQLAEAVVGGSIFYVWSEWSHTSPVRKGAFTTSGIDGYSFDLTTRKWVPTSFDHAAQTPAWTGSQILLPAYQPPCACAGLPQLDRTGSRIDPITGRQYVIPHGPIDDIGPAYLWTGSVLLAVNTSGSMGGAHAIYPGSAAYWTPATDRWTSLPRAPRAGYGSAVVWTGRSLLIWGQLSPSGHPSGKPTGGGIELSH